MTIHLINDFYITEISPLATKVYIHNTLPRSTLHWAVPQMNMHSKFLNQGQYIFIFTWEECTEEQAQIILTPYDGKYINYLAVQDHAQYIPVPMLEKAKEALWKLLLSEKIFWPNMAFLRKLQ